MKTIDTEDVKPYVNGVLHSLDLVKQHMEAGNERGAQIELENAKRELIALLDELEGTKP